MKSRVDAAQTAANNANSRCSSLESWRNSKTFASESWVNSNFTTQDTFNQHQHLISNLRGWNMLGGYDTYFVSGVGDISHITSTGDAHSMYTSTPQ